MVSVYVPVAGTSTARKRSTPRLGAPSAYTARPPEAPLMPATRAPEVSRFAPDSASYVVGASGLGLGDGLGAALGGAAVGLAPGDADAGVRCGARDPDPAGDPLSGAPVGDSSTVGITGRPGTSGGSAPDAGPGGGRSRTSTSDRSEERRVGKECRSRWSPY